MAGCARCAHGLQAIVELIDAPLGITQRLILALDLFLRAPLGKLHG
jgi:hypothetical protein